MPLGSTPKVPLPDYLKGPAQRVRLPWEPKVSGCSRRPIEAPSLHADARPSISSLALG